MQFLKCIPSTIPQNNNYLKRKKKKSYLFEHKEEEKKPDRTEYFNFWEVWDLQGVF